MTSAVDITSKALENKDKAWLRWTAGTMFAFEVISTALVIVAVFEYFVPHFGDVTHLWEITPALAVECIFSLFITFIAQFYFAYQIKKLKPPSLSSTILIWVLAIFATLSLLFGCLCSSMMFIHSDWEKWAMTIQIGFIGSKGAAMLFDIISTVTMCIYLKRANPDVSSGIKRVIQWLTWFCIQRGVLVTVVQSVLVIINPAFINSTYWEMYWLTPHLLVTRLYVNTFFAMLNSRKYLRNENLATHIHMDSDSTVSVDPMDFNSMPTSKVTTTTAATAGTDTFKIEKTESVTGHGSSVHV